MWWGRWSRDRRADRRRRVEPPPPPGLACQPGHCRWSCTPHWLAARNAARITEPRSKSFCASGTFFSTRSHSPVLSMRGSPPRSACRTSTWPSSTTTSVESASSTLTSKVVPRTEMMAVGVRTRLWFGIPAELLDVDLDAANPHLDQILPVAGRVPECDARVRENLKRAAVGDSELGVSVGAGDDDLLRTNLRADIQSPRLRVTKNGDLAGKHFDRGGSAGRVGLEDLGRADPRRGCQEQPQHRSCPLPVQHWPSIRRPTRRGRIDTIVYQPYNCIAIGEPYKKFWGNCYLVTTSRHL